MRSEELARRLSLGIGRPADSLHSLADEVARTLDSRLVLAVTVPATHPVEIIELLRVSSASPSPDIPTQLLVSSEFSLGTPKTLHRLQPQVLSGWPPLAAAEVFALSVEPPPSWPVSSSSSSAFAALLVIDPEPEAIKNFESSDLELWAAELRVYIERLLSAKSTTHWNSISHLGPDVLEVTSAEALCDWYLRCIHAAVPFGLGVVYLLSDSRTDLTFATASLESEDAPFPSTWACGHRPSITWRVLHSGSLAVGGLLDVPSDARYTLHTALEAQLGDSTHRSWALVPIASHGGTRRWGVAHLEGVDDYSGTSRSTDLALHEAGRLAGEIFGWVADRLRAEPAAWVNPALASRAEQALRTGGDSLVDLAFIFLDELSITRNLTKGPAGGSRQIDLLFDLLLEDSEQLHRAVGEAKKRDDSAAAALDQLHASMGRESADIGAAFVTALPRDSTFSRIRPLPDQRIVVFDRPRLERLSVMSQRRRAAALTSAFRAAPFGVCRAGGILSSEDTS